MASIAKRPNGRWRARYRDAAGKEHARHFDRKTDAQKWLDAITADLVKGTYVDPKTARITVARWCDTWLDGYGTQRKSTVRQARVHVQRIKAAFGPQPLSSVRASQVKSWTSSLVAEGLAPSYIYALHTRLAQIMNDAVIDGIIPRSPCSRKTSPGQGDQRPYVATTEQVFALHDAMPERLRAAILLGAFAGLRCAEACGLRVPDVDFMRGVISPAVQFPAEPLKSDVSRTPIPIAPSVTLALSEQVRLFPGATVLTGADGGQLSTWALERAIRTCRARVYACSECETVQARRGRKFRCSSCGSANGTPSLPPGFRYHDLRHYFASLLIAAREDVKKVQARMRHALATTTLNTYGHLWPDSDETSRVAVEAVFEGRRRGPGGPSEDSSDHPFTSPQVRKAK
jgi:integrase